MVVAVASIATACRNSSSSCGSSVVGVTLMAKGSHSSGSRVLLAARALTALRSCNALAAVRRAAAAMLIR